MNPARGWLFDEVLDRPGRPAWAADTHQPKSLTALHEGGTPVNVNPAAVSHRAAPLSLLAPRRSSKPA